MRSTKRPAAAVLTALFVTVLMCAPARAQEDVQERSEMKEAAMPQAPAARETTEDARPSEEGTPVSGKPQLPGDVAVPKKGKSAEDAPKDPAPSLKSGGADPQDSMTMHRHGKPIEPDVDELTGALRFGYRLTLPPGRNGMEPDLTLSYDSQRRGQDGIFGYGWSMGIPWIGRLNRYGAEKMYAQPVYTSELDGELAALSSGAFVPRVEQGSFRSYAFSGNAWTVQDTMGRTYRFGTTAASRQDDATGAKIYRWYLDEVRDANGNRVNYQYVKSQGQVYPQRIAYTGHGTAEGPFSVEFSLAPRPDDTLSYAAGFPVTTASRVSEIRTRISGVTARSYALSYSAGDNGERSLLSSVTETGYDDASVATPLPPTTFGYRSATATPGWAKDPVPVEGLGDHVTMAGYDRGYVIVDINGDGLADEVNGLDLNGTATTSSVALNTGHGAWMPAPEWTIPLPTARWRSSYSPPEDLGTRFADVNGDGLVDVMKSVMSAQQNGSVEHDRITYLNTGSGWAASATWTPPTTFVAIMWGGERQDGGVRFADVNGDGLTDLVDGGWDLLGVKDRGIYYNTGSGWVKDGVPPVQITNGTREYGVRIVDLNGDGLQDFTYDCIESGYEGGTHAELNNGNGTWTRDESWAIPLPTCTNTWRSRDPKDTGTRFMDVNNDGLVDVLMSTLKRNVTSNPVETWLRRVYLNTGTGWVRNDAWVPPPAFWQEDFAAPTTSWYDTGTRIADTDGNGTEDIAFVSFVPAYPNLQERGIYRSRGVPELLSSATTSQGGAYSWEYRPTTMLAWDLLNPKLPHAMEVVATSTRQSGFGVPEVMTYSYRDGKYWSERPNERKFAGFGSVVATDAAGNSVKSFFHQGDASSAALGEHQDHESKIGRRYREEVFSAAGNLMRVTVDRWERADNGTSTASFVYRAHSLDMSYDGNSTHQDRAESFAYDLSNGNLSRKISWGDVSGTADGLFSDIGSDRVALDISYATNTSLRLLGFPSRETLTDQAGTKVRETLRQYDLQAPGGITKGNLTKERRWMSGSLFADTDRTYDARGLVTEEKNPRGHATSFTHDAHGLYPAVTTAPLGLVTVRAYDYSSGLVRQTTDPNLLVTSTRFDGLDRPLEEFQPDPSSGSAPVLKMTYVYADVPQASSVKRVDWLDGSNGVETWTYLDGFGRPVQVRKEAETGYVARDYLHDARGLLAKESVPYASAGSARTAPTYVPAHHAVSAYDALRRLASLTDALGVTSYAHDDRVTSVTDARGNTKRLFRDAFDRLVRVEEVMSSTATLVTQYVYGADGSLTRITDAMSNVRHFTYDGLGRRLTAQDLHAPSDASFGTWTYAYDANGNVKTVLDPKGQAASMSYDALDRLTAEDVAGTPGAGTLFTYDACALGKGKLCSAATSGATSTFAYGPTGQVIRETRIIDGVPYLTETSHDRQGNVLMTVLPDGASARFLYGLGGQMDRIDRKEAGDPDWKQVITDMTYSPHGAASVLSYGNGAMSTDSFDSSRRYRLNGKTTSALGIHLQKNAYSYDAVGNITRIDDTSDTASAKSVTYQYDALNRLTQALTSTASGYGTRSYAYDALGNILSESVSSGTSTPAVAAYAYGGHLGASLANPHAATSVGGAAYAYDANGNLVSRGGGTFVWDVRNRLAAAVTGGATSTFAYAHDGSRVKAAGPSGVTRYVSGSYSVRDGIPTKRLFAGGRLVATVEGSTSTAVVRYVHTDHLTGSAAVTSATGAPLQVLDYHPYGAVRIDQKTSSYSEARKFAGHEYDVGTGLSYMGARYYDGNLGRFLSQDPMFLAAKFDPADPQGMNSYAYSRNNPLRYIDPDGKWFRDVITGRQSFGAFMVELGDAGNYLYNNSTVAQTVMDHPYATGAVVGVAGGVAAAGAAAVAPAVGAFMTTPQAITGAAVNVSGQALQDLTSGQFSGASSYAYSAVTGAAGGGIVGAKAGAAIQGLIAGAYNVGQQSYVQGKQNIDWKSAGIAAGSAAVSSKIMGAASLKYLTPASQAVGQSVLNGMIEIPGQVINTGLQRSEAPAMSKKKK